MTSPWLRTDGTRRGSSRLEQKIRLQVLSRDGWVCRLCGLPIDPSLKNPHPMSAQVHHTRADTGYDARYLVASHRKCNIEVGEPDKHDPQPMGATRW